MNEQPPIISASGGYFLPRSIMEFQGQPSTLNAVVTKLKRMIRIGGRDHAINQSQERLKYNLLALQRFLRSRRDVTDTFLSLVQVSC